MFNFLLEFIQYFAFIFKCVSYFNFYILFAYLRNLSVLRYFYSSSFYSVNIDIKASGFSVANCH